MLRTLRYVKNYLQAPSDFILTDETVLVQEDTISWYEANILSVC